MDPVTPIRTIQLRRPPVLVEVAGRFVPERATLEEVDARWAELCAANPRYFDGSIVQVSKSVPIAFTRCRIRSRIVQDLTAAFGRLASRASPSVGIVS